ncbi:MAG: efflux RND transporter permease subunit [Bacteroidales bacterium]|nr:efflux RND transporter permease subunit [Bacteroidales bacterium]
MKKIITIFVKYPFYANIIIVILILGGWIGISNMKKSFFPERQSRNITITVTYPGASPKEMEEGITVRIEEAIRGIVGIKEINSTSSENFSRVRIETTGDYDIDETLTEVKNAVDGISSFPVDAERPIIYKQRSITQAMYLGLSGNVDLMSLKKLANEIEDDLLASGIITQLRINGYPPIEISVEVTEENLLRYNLTFDEILRAITLNNRDISGGQIKSEKEEILIRSRSRSVNPDDIGEIILRANNDGSHLLIRDIANVKLKFSDIPSAFLMNGKQAISFSVSKLPEEDLDEISAFCNKYAKEFNANHNDVKLEVSFDFLSMLGSRLELLYKNGSIGLFLVIFSLALFLSFRLSLWVAWGIPASFLAMFIVGSMYGITINMISLFGMILVIGILVDDGIVIAENIYTHFEKGKSPRRAAIDGTMEVLPAVITSVTTTMIAFSPLMLIQGGGLEFMFEMAFVVVFSLFFSLFEAFLVLPAHLGSKHILRSRKKSENIKNIRSHLNNAIAYMRYKIYGYVLKLSIKWKWITLTIPISFFIITIGLFGGGFIKYTMFPAITFDFFNIDIAFKPGSGEKKTFEYLKKFDDIVWEVNEELIAEYGTMPEYGLLQKLLIKTGITNIDTNSYIQYTYLGIGNAFSGQEIGSHTGGIFVTLRDMEGLPVSSYEITNRIRKKIGKIPEAEKMSIGAHNRFGKPVSISLLGKDLKELEQAKRFLIEELNNLTTITNITDNNAAGKQEVRLKLKPKAYFLGLDQTSILNQIRQGFFGGQAQRLQSGKDEIRVWVRYPKTGRQNLGQLDEMKIKTVSGEYPLTELVDYTIERGPVNINRFNLSREIRIEADLVDPYESVPPILQKIREDIVPKVKAKYSGVDIQHQGQQRRSDEAQSEMMKYFGIAFAIIILILMIHFKSASQALIVIMMIPLAWLGSIWGHGVEGFPVSMLSAWGMVALSGIIINDAVIFLAKYNSLLLEGQKVIDAVYNAGIARFRAIVLTTITTVMGLYPLIMENSFQAQFLIPMAIALAYGVLFGTAFILLFFPSLILVLNDIKIWTRWLWNGILPTRESVETTIINSKRTID